MVWGLGWMQCDPQLWAPFCTFAKAHVESWDLDPMYPVLRRFYEDAALPKEVALWRTMLYLTWYHIGTAEKAWNRWPEPAAFSAGDVTPYATGTERRCFRGNVKAGPHLAAFLADTRGYGSLSGWADAATSRGGKFGWQVARMTFQQIPYGGQWSSYKLADLLKHVHGYPITANDIGVGGGGETAGPVPGMVKLTGADWKRCAADVGLQQELHDEAVRCGVPFNGLDQLETSLCDFNSLLKGGYYVGHDIDVQQEQLRDSGGGLLAARMATFEPKWLGEVGGWNGVRKPLKGLFKERGEIRLP